MLSDVTGQGDAPGPVPPRSLHEPPEGIHFLREFHGNAAFRHVVAFRPVEGSPVKSAAGATGQAGIRSIHGLKKTVSRDLANYGAAREKNQV